jgi:hypothetical protein
LFAAEAAPTSARSVFCRSFSATDDISCEKTTAVSYPISRLGNKNGKCGGSNPQATLNDFYHVMGLSMNYSGLFC